MKQPLQPYIYTTLALAAVLFLGVMAVVVSADRSDSTTGVATTNQTETEPTVVADDPLITGVPAEQQSAQAKTKVFVSSLDPLFGPADAKVFVILFGAFTDPVMQTYLQQVAPLVAQYPNDVAIVWKDSLATVADTAAAQSTAVIAHCLNEQGLFWSFAAQPTTDALALAKQVGADSVALVQCMDEGGYEAVVAQGTQYGQSVGVINSHSVFFNDELYTGSLSPDELQQKIAAILATF